MFSLFPQYYRWRTKKCSFENIDPHFPIHFSVYLKIYSFPQYDDRGSVIHRVCRGCYIERSLVQLQTASNICFRIETFYVMLICFVDIL